MHTLFSKLGICPEPELPPTWQWVADRIERKDYAGLTKVQAVAIFEEKSRRMFQNGHPMSPSTYPSPASSSPSPTATDRI